MTDPVTLALPWYQRSDYQALLTLFSDPDKMPSTFDAWLAHAEGVEKQLRAAGFAVVRVWLRPGPFKAWCTERGMRPDQRARFSFVNEAAREDRRPPEA